MALLPPPLPPPLLLLLLLRALQLLLLLPCWHWTPWAAQTLLLPKQLSQDAWSSSTGSTGSTGLSMKV
jgi:hypothetical protein